MTLINASWVIPYSGANWGPFEDDNGNLYVVLKESGATNIDVYKSAAGGGSWTAQDTANNPTALDAGSRVAVAQSPNGDELHLAYYDSTTTGDRVNYAKFNMSSAAANADTWRETDTSVVTGCDAVQDQQTPAIGVRSDGDVVIVYHGPHDRIMGTNYQRVDYTVHQGTAWGDASGSFSTAANEEHDLGCVGVMGASDKFHVFWVRDPGTATIRHRSLSSTNSLGTEHDADLAQTISESAAPTVEVNIIAPPVYYDSSGTERIVYAFIMGDSTVDGVRVGYVAADGTPTDIGRADTDTNQIVNVSATGVSKANHFSLAVDGTTIYLVYSGGGSDGSAQDIYYTTSADGASFATPTQHLAATLGNIANLGVSAHVNGTNMGIVYGDHSSSSFDPTYTSFSIASGSTTPQTVAATSTMTAALSLSTIWAQTVAATSTMTPAVSTVSTWARTLAATSTMTAAVVKNVKKTVAATSAMTAAVVKNVKKTVAATSTMTPALTAAKLYSRTLAATSTMTAAMSRVVTYYQTLAATSTMTASVQKTVKKTLAATSSMTAAVIKKVQKTLSVNSTLTPAMTRANFFTVAINATTTATAGMTRVMTYAQAVAATSVMTPAIVKLVSKTLAATSTMTPLVVKKVSKTLSVVSSMTPVLAAVNLYQRTLAATSTMVASVTTSKTILQAVDALSTMVAALATLFIPAPGGGPTYRFARWLAGAGRMLRNPKE